MQADDDRVYIVTDAEFDGPVPGTHSMLAFASVAVSAKGRRLEEFEATLERLPGAQQAPETMAFWRRFPEGYEAATRNPRPPSEVMTYFVLWVKSFRRDCVFVAHPLALDGIWFEHYLRRFAGCGLYEGPWRKGRLFNSAPLCLASFAAGRLHAPAREGAGYPAAWLGNEAHTHRAIDDARGYANLLAHLLTFKV